MFKALTFNSPTSLRWPRGSKYFLLNVILLGQPWTGSRDCYFDYLSIPVDYLIIGQNIANSCLQWKRDFYSWKPFL